MEQTVKAVKPPTELGEQVRILKERGLFIENETEAVQILEHINYYRLRGYYIHLQKDDKFADGVSFNQIVALHNFDSELRAILLTLLLDIEIVARARISYIIAHAWGTMGYRDTNNYTCSEAKVMLTGIQWLLPGTPGAMWSRRRHAWDVSEPLWQSHGAPD